MAQRFGFSIVALIVLLALGGTGVAQSSPGEESSVNKTPPATSEPRIVNGQLVYKVGPGVTPPRAKFSPSPEYSKEARKAKYQGTCVLWLIVGADGNPTNIRVARTLGKGLDEKAIEAVKRWKFEPAKKDGQPVATEINVEVSFHLY
jgi:TonB family protein